MLSPNRLFYAIDNNIYEISAILSAQYKWNKYDIITQYNWNKYNISQTLSERTSTSDVGMMCDTYSGGAAYIPGTYKHNWDAVFSSKPSYSLTTYHGSPRFNVTSTPTKTYSQQHGLPVSFSGSPNGDGTYTITTIDGFQDFWVCQFDRDTTYTSVLNHFTLPDTKAYRYTTTYIRFSAESGYYIYAAFSEGAGSFIATVSSEDASEYPSNGKSGSYWYISQGSSQAAGAFVETVESSVEDAYPDNGIKDGYWYIKQ